VHQGLAGTLDAILMRIRQIQSAERLPGKTVCMSSDNAAPAVSPVGLGLEFLGMGDRYVAVRPSAVSITFNASENKWHATMNVDSDQLKSAPEYKYPSKS
jgi:hypothetical protein